MYEYDAGGRLISSRPEPEWDDEQQIIMLGLQHYEASLCALCGLPSDVCTAPENESRFAVEGPIRCHKTTALVAAAQKLDPKYPQPEALMMGAALKPSPGR